MQGTLKSRAPGVIVDEIEPVIEKIEPENLRIDEIEVY